MIRIVKDSKHSIKLEFNSDGAIELSNALQDTLNLKEHVVKVGEGSNISTPNKPVKYLKFAVCNKRNMLSVSTDNVVIELDEDEIEYGIKRLKDCISGEEFYPAEFSEVTYNSSTLTIYAFLVR